MILCIFLPFFNHSNKTEQNEDNVRKRFLTVNSGLIPMLKVWGGHWADGNVSGPQKLTKEPTLMTEL